MKETSYKLPEITFETLEYYAFTNRSLLEGKARAIVLDFHGLGDCRLRHEASEFEILCAKNGIITVFPYYGPWSWMNSAAVKYVDEVLSVLCKGEGLDINAIPIISTGGSMGGLSALIYTRYAKITPKACLTNCPVCDLYYHATERPDLPRTVYLAFNYGKGTLEEEIIGNSPYHQAESMPDIPYYVLHGTEDKAVNIDMHSRRFVERMKSFNKNVKLVTVEGMEHCDLRSVPDVKAEYFNEIIKSTEL